MDVGKAYTFVTNEDGWIGKLAVASVVLLFSWLIIPIFFLFGYQVAVGRRVMAGEEHPMPSWGDDLGKLFVDGAIIGVAAFVYSLPLWLFSFCYVLIGLSTGFLGDNGDLNAVFGGISGIGAIFFTCIMVLYGILLAFVIPALYIQYIRSGDFGSLFRVGEVFGIVRDNLVDILITIVANWAANLVVSVVGTILLITICGGIIVFLAGTAWAMISLGHLYGQIAAKIEGQKAEAAYAM